MQTAFRSEERFTQQEFRLWLQDRPDGDSGHYELIDGHIVMSPPAGYPHEKVITRILHVLLEHVVPRGLGEVLGSSAGYDLPSGDTLEPDAVFISTSRLEAGPRPQRGEFYRIVPDLVVEVLSDSTAKRDRTEKKDIYAGNGVDEFWLVDTEAHEIALHVRDGRTFVEAVVVREGPLHSRVLPGIDLRVETIFAGLD